MEPAFEYNYLRTWIWLNPDKVSLPSSGLVASADFTALLPAKLQNMYLDKDQILRTDISTRRRKKLFCGIRDSDYRALILKLEDAGLVTLIKPRPRVLNGVLAVPKSERDQQRLIIDARNANSFFAATPVIELPNPGHLARLYLPAGSKLFIAKSDMDNQYHRMRVPEWLRTYLGLPGVQREGHTVYPIINSMPMGWSHSVYVAQNVHLQILQNAKLPMEQWITKSIVVKEFTFGAYVDDYFSLGTSREQAEKHLEAVIRESKESGLPSKPQKVSWPGKEDYTEVLGIEVHSNGNLVPRACNMKELISHTKEFEQRRWWPTRGLQSVIGKWAWFILLRRPLFSIFQKVYELAARDSKAVPALPEARAKLRLIMEMSPLIRASLGRMFSEVVLCTDASLIGGGSFIAELILA